MNPTGALFWALIYGALVLVPLLILVSGLGISEGAGWWFDFSMGLGFGALAIMGGQFVLTARFRRATAPFGIDVIYVFHRWLAGVGLSLVVAHYLILKLRYPATLVPVAPFDAPTYMTAGRAALALFALLIGSSIWRKTLGIEYDRWRVAHAVLAVSAMVFAVVHVRGVGYYSGIFWNRTVLDAFLFSLVALVLYVRLLKPMLATSVPYRVTEVRPERGNAWTLRLQPDGHSGLRFMPGQFAWLSLGVSPWRAKEHPFSFSESSEREDGLQFTIKELGDFTSRVGQTPVGTVAYVDGPHGSFSVDRYPEAPGFFFLAGGVGIAPMLSMLRSLADRRDLRPLWLMYGSRSWERVIHRDELERLSGRLDLRITHVLIEPPERWEGEEGLPDAAMIERVLADAPDGIHCFLCGPEPMCQMAQRALRAMDIDGGRIHFELFDMA
jgi:predicted ferric reductase